MEQSHPQKRSRKRKELQNIIRERQFNNRYRATEKSWSYQPLSDPHSAYFFSSKQAKKHLNAFKKIVAHEPNNAIKKQLTSLIEGRIAKNQEQQLIIKRKTFASPIKSWNFKQLAKKSMFSLNTAYNNKKTNSIYLSKENNKMKTCFFEDKSFDSDYEVHPNNKEEPLNSNSREFNNPQHKINIFTMSKRKTKQQMKAEQLRQELHEKKHQKWLNFLEQKKKIVKSQLPHIHDCF